jgi:AraC-like DNA-binding protein
MSPAIIREILKDSIKNLPKELSDIADGAENVGYYHLAPISQPILSVLHEIIFCPYSGAVRKLFLESKALELVALKFAQIQVASHDPVGMPKIYCNDINKIYEAENLLKRDLENPPLLHELAREVGMSPKKLNTGFRKTFGTTVFKHLQRIRLERARYLMEKQKKNVTEAALAVGYNSIPSFSKAFSRHFLAPPKKYTQS